MSGDPFPKERQLARGSRRYRRKVASAKQWQRIHPRFEERARDVALERVLAESRAAFAGPPATAAWRLEQAAARAPLFRAGSAGQLTEAEFHRLHGLVSLTRGYEIGGKVQRMSASAAAHLLGEIAEGMSGWGMSDEMAVRRGA